MSLGSELIQSAEEALAVARGESEPAGTYVPETVNVAVVVNTSTKLNLCSPERLAAKAAAARGGTTESAQSVQSVHSSHEGTLTETRRDAPS